MWDTVHGHGGFMAFGGFVGILFWIALILIVVALAKWLFANTSGREAPRTPLEILKQRYAAGEIGEDEFQRMKKQLEDNG